MNCADHHGKASRRAKERCPAWWWDGWGLVSHFRLCTLFIVCLGGFRAENICILSRLWFCRRFWVPGAHVWEGLHGWADIPWGIRLVLSLCIVVMMFFQGLFFQFTHKLSSCKRNFSSSWKTASCLIISQFTKAVYHKCADGEHFVWAWHN